MQRTRVLTSCIVFVTIAICENWCPALSCADSTIAIPPVATSVGLPGEFEWQDAILLGWEVNEVGIHPTLLKIIRATWRELPVVVLVANEHARQSAITAMRNAGIPQDVVTFLPVPVDTSWARDYGPASVKRSNGTFALIDTDYDPTERPNDNRVPSLLALQFTMPAVTLPLLLEGGNLLSNGAGLCISSRTVVTENLGRGVSETQVVRMLRDTYGAAELLLLEPLIGESTGHVDMFATFPRSDTVVVGQYDPEIDEINAKVLDRNAKRLAKVVTPFGRLKVVRVPMPDNDFDTWRTHTNVLYANRKLLVPTYPGFDERERQISFATYRRLLPGWQVVGIDCNDIIECGGAIHCVALNLGRMPKLPPRRGLELPPVPKLHDAAPNAPALVRRSPLRRNWRQATSRFENPRPWAAKLGPPSKAAGAARPQPAITSVTLPPPVPQIHNESGRKSEWNRYRSSARRLQDYGRDTLRRLLTR